jgi:xanthine dehydrogenase large subunit
MTTSPNTMSVNRNSKEQQSRQTKAASQPHDSASTHVSGLSEYVDDRPEMQNELHCAVIYSTEAHARILSIDATDCKTLDGFFDIITAEDVHHNCWGPIFKDQPILAKDVVQYYGEIVAVVAAKTLATAKLAAKRVKVCYEPLDSTMSIQQAISKRLFIGGERKIERGDPNVKGPHQVTGKLIIQGADHFYLESNAVVVYPKENRLLEVHSSSQHPTETQHVVAEACGLAFSDVICIVKRLGGGFGGKESQAAPIAAYCALMAHKTNRPCRLILTKDDDMIITGKRNPFEIFYDCTFQDDGAIISLDAKLYSDAGAYADLSTAIMERAMLHCDNAYFIPNIFITGQVCKTNHHPHTAFRGFGGPKGVALIELIMEKIAIQINIDALKVRKRNMYRQSFDITHYGQRVENNMLPSLFESLEEECHYKARRKEISDWNRSHQSTIKGLSLTAVKFGISFTTRFLNQGNALVNIHRDGSVQVSTGAVEMGQGVNQRIATLVSSELGVPVDLVRMLSTSTERNANTSPTAASSGTDINGAAALRAVGLIKERLAKLAAILSKTPKEQWPSQTAGLGTAPEIELASPIDAESKESKNRLDYECQFLEGVVFIRHQCSINTEPAFSIKFSDLVNEAYLSRISLCEYSHFKIENLGFNKITGQGQAFLYFTQGVAASEVEICRYTGDVKVRRVDILMDLGRPINEALDIGQVTGAFVQGMGWVTTENLVYNKKGLLLTHSPSTYKIPNIQDTPREFNVQLIDNDRNQANIKGTKAVGEPPLLLGISVWTAIQNALSSSPKHLQLEKIPATNEVILRAMHPDLGWTI